MIIKVSIENWPTCPFQTKDGNWRQICTHDKVSGECDEKAPEDCPLRKSYVVVARLEEFESYD